MAITRIASSAANTQMVNYLLRTQADLHEKEVQVASEKKSQTYDGIASDAERLIDVENSRGRLERYNRNNDALDLKLGVTDNILTNVNTLIRDFKKDLETFRNGDMTDRTKVNDIQSSAWRFLRSMQVELNTEVNGQFLFSGGRQNKQPVNFPFDSLASLQSQFDGEAVQYPVTRAAHVNTDMTLTNAQTGNISFIDSGATGDIIRATTAGAFNGIAPGTKITVSGSGGAGNDKTYTVAQVANNGQDLVIDGTITGTTVRATQQIGTATAGEAGVTITTFNWYGGDRHTLTHRAGDNQEFDLDLNAINPAFEKAMRGMAIIAQGVFGTNGGLDNNTGRVNDAVNLLGAAVDPPPTNVGPYGTEELDNVHDVHINLGFQQLTLNRAEETNSSLIGFFDQKISEMENVDKLEAITEMLDSSRALEASYQALSRIRKLSLSQFI